MLFEKRIREIVRSVVKEELKEQIRKQTLRIRVLSACQQTARNFGNPTGASYYSQSEEIKEAIDKELEWVGKLYNVEIRSFIQTRYSDVFGTECNYDEYHFEVKEKGSDEWIDIDKW